MSEIIATAAKPLPDARFTPFFTDFPVRLVVGTNADFVYVDHPTDTGYNLTGLTTGATVKVCLTAVNTHGETQKGDAAQIVVP